MIAQYTETLIGAIVVVVSSPVQEPADSNTYSDWCSQRLTFRAQWLSGLYKHPIPIPFLAIWDTLDDPRERENSTRLCK